MRERVAEVAAAVQRLAERAPRREILRRAAQHLFELALRFVEVVQFEEGAAEGDAGREVSGMTGEAGAADVHRFLQLPCPAALFGELRESDRRRILLDPASKVFNPRIVCQGLVHHDVQRNAGVAPLAVHDRQRDRVAVCETGGRARLVELMRRVGVQA